MPDHEKARHERRAEAGRAAARRHRKLRPASRPWFAARIPKRMSRPIVSTRLTLHTIATILGWMLPPTVLTPSGKSVTAMSIPRSAAFLPRRAERLYRPRRTARSIRHDRPYLDFAFSLAFPVDLAPAALRPAPRRKPEETQSRHINRALFAPDHAAPIAFIAGVLGPLIGADLFHLKDVNTMRAAIVSIGASGTFDGAFPSGIPAAYLA